jgi:hypothetical protein
MATTSSQVQQLYVAYLGRAADKAGLDYWMKELNAVPATLTLENLRANFVNEQPEYANAYAGLSRSDTVIKIYNNLFGRTPDAAGLTYWTTGAGASVNADQLLTAFVNGAATADAAVLSNKVLVSEVYTSAAGANYAKADATSILVGVNGTSTSVAAAIAKLEDGSLSGIAIPAGVAALKAAALAEKAVIDYDASKVEALKALNDKVVALNETHTAVLTAITDGADTGTTVGDSYSEVVVAIDNATALRTNIGAATPILQAQADQAVKDLAATRDTYTKAATGNVDKAVAYEKALATAASLKLADPAVVLNTTSKTQIDFTTATAGAPGAAALLKANADAGLAVGTVTDAATLFTALTSNTATTAQVKAITDAFDVLLKGSADYAALKTLAVTNHTKAVADLAVTETAAAITGTGAAQYKTDVADKVLADKTLADAKAADALVETAKGIADGHKALEDAADAIVAPGNLKVLGLNGTDKADLFHFAAKVTTDDFTIGTAAVATQFGKGDALYIGEGYTLNTTAKYDAATGLTGGKNGALEVFFIKDAGVVKAVVEVSDLGSSTVVGGTLGSVADQVSVITLTGVTDIAQVSFANGVISHVA